MASGASSFCMQTQHASAEWKASALSRNSCRAPAASQKTSQKVHKWEETWSLVWCHERSRRQENQEVRGILCRHAKNSGAKLVCLRKAKDFIHMFSVAAEPYVLFTDLREVKVIVETMNRQSFEQRPIFTIVSCIDAKQQQKASRWLSNLTEQNDSIYLVGDLASITSTVPQLLLQAAHAVGEQKDAAMFDEDDEKARLRKTTALASPTCGPIPPTTKAVQSALTCQSFQLMQDSGQLSKDGTKAPPVLHLAQPMPQFQQSELNRDNLRAVPRLALIQPKDGAQSHHVFPLVQLGEDGRHSSRAFPCVQSKTCEMLAMIHLKGDMQGQFTQVKNEDAQASQSSQPTQLKADRVYAPHVAQVLGAFPCAAEVERALLNAVPEYYED